MKVGKILLSSFLLMGLSACSYEKSEWTDAEKNQWAVENGYIKGENALENWASENGYIKGETALEGWAIANGYLKGDTALSNWAISNGYLKDEAALASWAVSHGYLKDAGALANWAVSNGYIKNPTIAELETWASNNGYLKGNDLVNWAISNGYLKGEEELSNWAISKGYLKDEDALASWAVAHGYLKGESVLAAWAESHGYIKTPSIEELETWAVAHGYLKGNDLVNWAVSNGYLKDEADLANWAVSNGYLKDEAALSAWAVANGYLKDEAALADWAVNHGYIVTPSQEDLKAWAEHNGYIKGNDLVDWAVANGYLKDEADLANWALSNGYLKDEAALASWAIQNGYLKDETALAEWAVNHGYVIKPTDEEYAAWAEANGYVKVNKTYNMRYAYEPTTLNYMDSNKAENQKVVANLVDGLIETDENGAIKPALATSWSQNGKTWTFNIRRGVKWVNSNGEIYEDVTAYDWVTSLKYALQSDEINYLITMFIENSEEHLLATEYLSLQTDAERITSNFFRTFASGFDKFKANGFEVVLPTVGENLNWFYGSIDTGIPSGKANDAIGQNAYQLAGTTDSLWVWYNSLTEEDEVYVNEDGNWAFLSAPTYEGTHAAEAEVAKEIVWESQAAQDAFNAALAEYSDFDNVGVKAVDDYTLEYTTYETQNYFVSALLHSAYYPANAEFIEEVGFENFGTTIEKMLYCGPHMLKTWDIESQVVLTKNKKYWDAENVHIDTVKLIKYDTSNSSNYGWVRTQYEQGLIDGFTVSSSDTEGWAKYVTGADGTGTIFDPAHGDAYSTESEMGSGSSYLLFLNRNFDYSWVEKYPNLFKTSLTKAEVAAGNKALANLNLRKALVYGLDRSYAQESNWAADYINKDQYLSNTYVPKEFAVDENGKDYVEYYAEVYATKNNMTTAQAAEKTAPGQDGLTDLAKAKQFMTAAYNELKDTMTFPIKLEYAGLWDADSISYDTEMIRKWNDDLKITVNGQTVQVIEIVRNSAIATEMDYLYASNYSVGHLTIMGWGPDYADPLTYLDTLTRTGAFASFAGIDVATNEDDPLLAQYEALVAAADAKSNPSERLAKFAEAEYFAIHEDAMVIPWYIPSRGTRVSVSKIVPYQAMKGSVGCVANKYKFMKVRKSAISRTEREELKAEYEAGKGAN